MVIHRQIDRYGKTQIDRYGNSQMDRYSQAQPDCQVSPRQIEIVNLRQINMVRHRWIDRYGKIQIDRYGNQLIERYLLLGIGRQLCRSYIERNCNSQIDRYIDSYAKLQNRYGQTQPDSQVGHRQIDMVGHITS